MLESLKEKFMKKQKIKYNLIIFFLALYVSINIFSDWKNFKAGITGKPPIKKIKKN